MLSLVRHFGDQSDSGQPCGQCDMCRPEDSPFLDLQRAISQAEGTSAALILTHLCHQNHQAAGRLFQSVSQEDETISRNQFESLVQLMAQQQWLRVEDASFTSEQKQISYRKISLTDKGRSVRGEDLHRLRLMDSRQLSSAKSSSRSTSRKVTLRKRSQSHDAESSPHQKALFAQLKAWRSEQAKKKGIPAFRILTDRVLDALCAEKPSSVDELLEVKGLGPKLVEKYGSELLRIVASKTKS